METTAVLLFPYQQYKEDFISQCMATTLIKWRKQLHQGINSLNYFHNTV